MPTMRGTVTEVKQAEMEVTQEDLLAYATTFLHPIDLIIAARKTWLNKINVYSGSNGKEVRLDKQELANGQVIHTWQVRNQYDGDWRAWQRTVTIEDVVTWNAFEKALEAVTLY